MFEHRVFSSRSSQAAMSQPYSAISQLTIATSAVTHCKTRLEGPLIPKTDPQLRHVIAATVTPDACEGESKHSLPGRDNQQRFKNHRQI